MKRALIVAAAGLAIGWAAPALGPSSAWAGQEKAEKAYKAELKECKKMADPRQKDDCVRNVRSTFEKRKQAGSKPVSGVGEAKEDQTKKAASQDRDAAIGVETFKKKAGKANRNK